MNKSSALLPFSVFLSCLSFISCFSSHETKEVFLPLSEQTEIIIDGIPNEPCWKEAVQITHFINPWNRQAEPYTNVNLLWNGSELYFYFIAHDTEVVLTDNFTTELDVSQEDRVELFFSSDLPLTRYYALEMDPLGRILDYEVNYPRKFNNSWNAGKHLHWTGKLTSYGYCVEGLIDSKLLTELTDGKKSFYLGAYRAEFSKDKNGDIIYEWLCIKDPHVDKPDFHVNETFIKINLQMNKNDSD